MNIIEMKDAARMLGKEWKLGKEAAKAKGNVCAWIYLFEILEESEDIVMLKDKNKLIGFGGYVKDDSKRKKWSKGFYHFLKVLLINSPFIKNKEGMIKYLKDYDYTPLDLECKYDGKVSILILDEQYRGTGKGKKMLESIFEKAHKNNIRKLQILTDESCNFNIYEKCGCVRVYETFIPTGENNDDKEKCFIYEKILR